MLYVYPEDDDGNPIYPCVGDVIEVGGNGCPNAVKARWSLVSGPVGAGSAFDDPNSDITTFALQVPGRHELQLCCWTPQEDAPAKPVEDPDQPPKLLCPVGVLVGGIVTVRVENCEGLEVSWSVGDNGTGDWQASGDDSIVIYPSQLGDWIIQATCTDPLTGEEVDTDPCVLKVTSADVEIVEEYGEPSIVDVVECGLVCNCDTVVFIVDDCEPECLEICAGYVVPGCKPETEPQIVTPSATNLIAPGSPIAFSECADIFVDPCTGIVTCCDPHQPTIIFNDACSCGWTFEVIGNIKSGSHSSFLCGCNPMRRLMFTGDLTIIASGPSQFIDTAIFWNHDLDDAIITSSPYSPFGGSTSFGTTSNLACLPPKIGPGVVYFNEVSDSTEQVVINISPADPEKCHSIGHLFLGQKMFFERDEIAMPWTNPHTGASRRVEIEDNDCGEFAVRSVRSRQSVEIPLKCISEAYAKNEIRSLVDYAETGRPLAFAWSRNNCPEDIFYGWMADQWEGSQYVSGRYQEMSLILTGYTKQLQPKNVA